MSIVGREGVGIGLGDTVDIELPVEVGRLAVHEGHVIPDVGAGVAGVGVLKLHDVVPAGVVQRVQLEGPATVNTGGERRPGLAVGASRATAIGSEGDIDLLGVVDAGGHGRDILEGDLVVALVDNKSLTQVARSLSRDEKGSRRGGDECESVHHFDVCVSVKNDADQACDLVRDRVFRFVAEEQSRSVIVAVEQGLDWIGAWKLRRDFRSTSDVRGGVCWSLRMLKSE